MRFITIICLILLSTASIFAQKLRPGSDWETIPIDEWTSDHVKYILEKSAWAKVIREGRAAAIGISGAPDSSLQVETVSLMNDTLVLLRSSLLIRYARFRQRQLLEKYDSMNTAAKEAFNLKNGNLIQCPACENYYIVSIAGLHATLRNKSLIMGQSQSVFLSNDKGEKRILANFTPQPEHGGEALFFFPRNNDKGEPLLRADSTKLVFNFTIPLMIDEEGFRTSGPRISMFDRMEFNSKDMVRNGKVIF